MTHQLEDVPTEWTVADEVFFSEVRRIFDPAFVYGAGVLLAGYDPAEPGDAATATGVTGTSAETPTAARTRRHRPRRATQ